MSTEEGGEWFLDNSGVWTELQNTEGDGAPMFQPQVKEIRDLRELAVLEGLFVMCHYWSVKSMEESWERPWMLGEEHLLFFLKGMVSQRSDFHVTCQNFPTLVPCTSYAFVKFYLK